MMLIKFSSKRSNLLVLIILSLTSVKIECRKTSKHQHKERNNIETPQPEVKERVVEEVTIVPELPKENKTSNVSPRQLFDGFTFSDLLPNDLGALENFDDILRYTIPQVDKFQCVERVMCEFSSSSQQQEPSSILGDLLGLGGGSNQGGIQTLQQQFLQDPAIQQQLAQFGGAGFQSPQGQVLQQFGQPQFQLAQPQTQFARPQVFQSPTQFGRPQVVQSQLQFGQQQFASPQTGFFREGSNALRRNEPTHETQPQEVQRVSHYQPPASYRPHPSVQQQIPQNPYVPRRRVMVRRKPQKNWFQRLFNLRRKKRDTQTQSDENLRQKRSLFDAFLGGWTNTRLFGILDQMAERYSFYPYTHAAYMGMTGGSDSCQTLYPECPSTPEEMINVVNNLHRHYPNGFPFKESIPWPFNLFLP